MEAERAHQDSRHTGGVQTGLSADPGARRQSGRVGGYYAAASVTLRA